MSNDVKQSVSEIEALIRRAVSGAAASGAKAAPLKRKGSFGNNKRYANKDVDDTWKGRGHHWSVVVIDGWDDLSQLGFEIRASEVGVDYKARYQWELAPSTQRLHLNMYLYTRQKKEWHQVKAWVMALCGPTIKSPEIAELKSLLHAQRWANTYSTKAYSRQDGTQPSEVGGASLPAEVEDGVGAPSDQEKQEKERDWSTFKREVRIYFGPNRTGKGYRVDQEAKAFAPEEKLYKFPTKATPTAARWVGEYKGEKCVLIDEFSFEDFPTDMLKILFDSKPSNVPAAMGGKQVFWCPELIFVVMNCTPKQMNVFIKHPQWHGRITRCEHMNVRVPDIHLGAPPICNFDENTSPDYSDGTKYFEPVVPKMKAAQRPVV